MNRKCFTLIKKEDKQARTQKQNRLLIQRFIYVSLTDLDIFTMKLKLITSPGSYWNFFCSVPLLNKETKEKCQISSFPIPFLIEV